MIIFTYPHSNQPLEFFTMIHQKVFDFSSFSGCLDIYPESSIPLTESVTHLSRHHIYPFFLPSGVIPRISTTLNLLVAFDDITK